jgi:hypothetical protein
MNSSPLGLPGALIRSALGFAAVSVAAFSVWAFAAPWIRPRFGEVGLYTGVAIAFLALSGLVFQPLAGGWARYARTFVPAFAAYAVIWSAIWFAMHSRLGEGLASLAGTAAFSLLVCVLAGNLKSFPKIAAALFVTHSVGYFLGGVWYVWCKDPRAIELMGGLARNAGRLGWGALYGLGFGAGLGYAFHALRRDPATVKQ